jgi:5-methylcytosine-specific restriction protein A
MIKALKPRLTPLRHKLNTKALATPRLRGRAGMKQRQRRLLAEPLCRDCKAEGKVTLATVPDHIVPLAFGGSDTDDNIRCLCEHHHRIRTREQFSQYGPAIP